jgi:hypothetical protein
MKIHPYTDKTVVVGRLVKEWREHGKLVIAYDYDNTVFDYHNEGHDYSSVIKLLRDCKEFGAHLVVFTACEEEKFPAMRQYLNDHDIPFDAINEQPDFLPFTGRKIYYNILLDDRAGLESACRTLATALYIMKEGL